MAGSLSSDPGAGFLQVAHARTLLHAARIAQDPTMYNAARRVLVAMLAFSVGWWACLAWLYLAGIVGKVWLAVVPSVLVLTLGAATGYLSHVMQKVAA